jgi:uncharacterized membrane protein SpoIIM required for sporulation
VDLDAFVTEHNHEWNRLQQLTAKRRGRLTPTEVDDLVVLYRRTATHLSVVRSRSPDPALVAWLTRLVLQARAAVSPVRGFSWRAVGDFFGTALPLEIYRARRWWLSVAAGFILLTGVLIGLVASSPDRARAFLSQDEINQLVQHDFEAYYNSAPPQDFALGVWTNNALITGLCLASGVLVFPVLYMLWQNALNTGVVGGVMVGNGRGDVFFGLITIHGLLELTCIFIAAGVGLRIGWSWIAPGPFATRGQSLARTARSSMVVALGLVLALAVSGFVEAFITPAPVIVGVKLGIGATVWLLFLLYVFLLGSAAERAGADSDVPKYERLATVPTV